MKQGLVSSEAFLLKASNYAETDQVLTLYLKNFGKVSCMAKGARASKLRFGACLRPFSKFEAQLRMPASQGLAFLESTQELESYHGLLSDLDRMASGWRLLELLDKLEEPGSVHPEIFDALEMGMAELSGPDWQEAGLRCEAALLALNGWAPRLDACVQCRKPWPFSSARFSFSEGGLLCSTCRAEGAWMALHDREATALMGLFQGGPPPLAAARALLTNFIQHQLGKGLRTETFARNLRGGL